MIRNDSPKAHKDNKEPYTPERLEKLAGCLKHLAAHVESTVLAMRADDVDRIELGDAMLRRSYRHIQHFVAAIERALDKHHAGGTGIIPRAPW